MVAIRAARIRSIRRQHQLNALQKIVAEWNEKHPVGTVVKIRNGLGVETQAPTSAPAMIMTKTTPVVWLKGVHNYVELSRVKVV